MACERRGGKCADAYIGGFFGKISGKAVQNIAEISTSTGKVVNAFAHSANKTVETLRSFGNHILVGGDYTTINGSKSDAYMTSLNPVTGKDDGFLHLGISGHYQFHNVKRNGTEVYNQQLSHNHRLLLVEGDFTKVGGLGRQQIFIGDDMNAGRDQEGRLQQFAQRQARAERRGVIDPGRQQLQPGTKAFFAPTTIGLVVDVRTADTQSGKCRRPTREIAHFLDAGKASTLMDDADALA